MPTPVIADIVQSRKLPDRAATQKKLQEVIAEVESRFRVPAGLQPTVGDEFQAIYASARQARTILLELKLALPLDVQLRFGIGIGQIQEVTGTALQDGPGWYAAREAIEQVEQRAQSSQSWLRTWFAADADATACEQLNSSLILEDFVLSKMKARERRITLMVLRGIPQVEVARSEKVSQPAVSQSLQRSGGAALIATLQLGQGRG